MWPFTRGDRAADDALLAEAEAALDRDPLDPGRFEQIDKIHTKRRDWKGQEMAYRRLIRRFGSDLRGDRQLTVSALWHALGEIYRGRLKDYPSAIRAIEISLEVKPGDDADPRHQSIRELRMLISQ